ncbi:hypothetical protein [Streptomyces lavendulocolor]|uniref:hypothetical protein n=1 Tax=Streptomyces lavendulocolor TaxID=67316 RepID=UPI003C2F4140
MSTEARHPSSRATDAARPSGPIPGPMPPAAPDPAPVRPTRPAQAPGTPPRPAQAPAAPAAETTARPRPTGTAAPTAPHRSATPAPARPAAAPGPAAPRPAATATAPPQPAAPTGPAPTEAAHPTAPRPAPAHPAASAPTARREAPAPARPAAPPRPAAPAPTAPHTAAPRPAAAPAPTAPHPAARREATAPTHPTAPHPAAPRPAGVPLPPEAPPAAAPTRRRPVGAVDLTPRPGAAGPPAAAPAGQPYWPPPETPAETTTRLRPVPGRHPARAAAAVACLVLGLGLTGGAAAGAWLVGDSAAQSSDHYAEARRLWHSVPVDTLFPRTLDGEGAGPGRADRTWTRVAVAPDGPCAGALDPLLTKALRPVGCERVLRATYTDATSTSVTTVGMVFTDADRPGMTALRERFADESLDERTDLLPRTLSAPGTVAARFGDAQRASWRVSVLTDAPVVVYAVSGFADGRTVDDPQPAAEAMAEGQTSTPAQAGLGHDADGIADRIERGLRTTAQTGGKATQEPR